jgi:hypothetical protein
LPKGAIPFYPQFDIPKRMDVYYIKPDDDDLKQAMDVYTTWFDEQLEATKQNDISIQHPWKKLFS